MILKPIKGADWVTRRVAQFFIGKFVALPSTSSSKRLENGYFGLKTPFSCQMVCLNRLVGACSNSRYSLSLTVKDMRALRQVLVNPDLCAYPDNDQHIHLLHNNSATRSAICDGLAWLKECSTAAPKPR